MGFLDRFNASTSSGNHMSPFGEAGLLFDPLAYIGGDKYKNFMRKTWEKPNEWLSPIIKKHDEYDRKINPLHRAMDKTEIGGEIKDMVHEKPADSALAILGSIFGGGALMGGLGGGGGAGGAQGQGLGLFANGGQGGMTGVGGGNAGALAQAGGIPGGAGMGSATPAASTSWQDLVMKQGLGGVPGANTGVPPQQQPPQYQPPQPQGIQPIDPSQVEMAGRPAFKPSLASRAMSGLGNLRDSLTPIDPRMAEGMDPEHVKQLRNQAILRMGLGMMSASGQGAGFGQALAAGLGQGVGGFNKDVEGAYERGVDARAEKRDEDREKELDKRFFDERGYRRDRDSLEDKRWQAEFDATNDYRRKTLAASQNRGEEGVNSQLITRPVGNGMVQDFAWNPRTHQRVPQGEPYRPNTTQSGNVSEGERRAAALATRMESALATIDTAQTTDKDASRPGLFEKGLEGLGMDMAANVARSTERQQANAAQLDALDAALTLATGAAYTREQLRGQAVSYFPQIGDDPETVRSKAARFETLIKTARIASGRAEPSIDKALASDTSPDAPPPAPRAFATEAEAEAAGVAPGTRVVIGGIPGTWQ
jgi:hypothetical protein